MNLFDEGEKSATEVKMHFVGVNYAPDSSGEMAAEPGGQARWGASWGGVLPSGNCGPEFGVLWNGA